MKRALIALALLAAAAVRSQAAAPIRYRLSFPEPQHRWMQVQATYTDLPSGALELRMSRSSPGRYSLHEFAKNVYDVEAADESGRLELTRPDPHGWTVPRHGTRVTVVPSGVCAGPGGCVTAKSSVNSCAVCHTPRKLA